MFSHKENNPPSSIRAQKRQQRETEPAKMMDIQSSTAHSQLPLPRTASTSTLRRLSSITAFANPLSALNARRERKASGGTPAPQTARRITSLSRLGLSSTAELEPSSTGMQVTPARSGRLPRSKTTSVLPSIFTKSSTARPPSRIPVPTGTIKEQSPAPAQDKARGLRRDSTRPQDTGTPGKPNLSPVLSDATNRLPDPSTPAKPRHQPSHSLSSAHQIKQHGLLKPVEPDPQPPGAFPQTPLTAPTGTASYFSARNNSNNKPRTPGHPLSAAQARRQSELSPASYTPSRASARFIQEVSQAQPDGYWAGRFTTVRDRTLNRAMEEGKDELPTRADSGTFMSVAAMKTMAEAEYVFDVLCGFCVTEEARASLAAFQVQYANNNHLPDLAYYVPRPLPSTGKARGSEASGSSATTTGSARVGSFVSRFKSGLRKSSGGKPVRESRNVYAN